MRYIWKYLLWLLTVVGLIIILIILLLPSSKKAVSGKTLVSYSSTNAVAQLTIDGVEGADQTHQAVRIDVSQNEVTFEQLAGYSYNVVNQQSYESNQTAYNVFLRALYYAGFTKGNTNPKDTNPAGVCPLGDRYIFNLTYNNRTIEDFWSTGCGQSTYGGNLSLTVTLFQNQVPNYTQLIRNVSL